MSTESIITIGVIILGFIGQAIYLSGNYGARIKDCEEEVEHLREEVQWKDTCKGLWNGLKDRVAALEARRNGKR